MDARVHIFTASALERGRVASPMLGHLYPRGKPPGTHFRRLSGPQDQSGHEGVKKNLHPSDTRAIQPLVKRLAAWATCPTRNMVALDKSVLVDISWNVRTWYIHCEPLQWTFLRMSSAVSDETQRANIEEVTEVTNWEKETPFFWILIQLRSMIIKPEIRS